MIGVFRRINSIEVILRRSKTMTTLLISVAVLKEDLVHARIFREAITHQSLSRQTIHKSPSRERTRWTLIGDFLSSCSPYNFFQSAGWSNRPARSSGFLQGSIKSLYAFVIPSSSCTNVWAKFIPECCFPIGKLDYEPARPHGYLPVTYSVYGF